MLKLYNTLPCNFNADQQNRFLSYLNTCRVDSIFFLKTNISSRAVHVRNVFFLGMNHVDGVPFLLFWLPYGLLSFIAPFFQTIF